MKSIIRWYEDLEGISLPAIKILECIFVMDDSEKILHFHKEELSTKAVGPEQRYFKNNCAPFKERSRCQVIPPFVNAFRKIKQLRGK